jgi:hypothetical protein
MALSVQQIIESFEGLPESEKQRVAYEILRKPSQRAAAETAVRMWLGL